MRVELDLTPARSWRGRAIALAVTIEIGLVIAGAATFGLRGGFFYHGFLAMWSTVAAVILGSAALVYLLLARLLRSRHASLAGWGLLYTAIIAGLLGLSIVPGDMLLKRDATSAKEYCTRLIPALEAYKTANGKYPESIEPFLPKEERPPRLLRWGKGDTSFYYPNKTRTKFTFEFNVSRRPRIIWPMLYIGVMV